LSSSTSSRLAARMALNVAFDSDVWRRWRGSILRESTRLS
jgi:hypothetical protein